MQSDKNSDFSSKYLHPALMKNFLSDSSNLTAPSRACGSDPLISNDMKIGFDFGQSAKIGQSLWSLLSVSIVGLLGLKLFDH